MFNTASLVSPLLGRTEAIVRRLTRYDLVLAVIPLAFAAAGLVGAASSVSFTTATGVASVVGLLAVLDALFINPPREPSGGQSAV